MREVGVERGNRLPDVGSLFGRGDEVGEFDPRPFNITLQRACLTEQSRSRSHSLAQFACEDRLRVGDTRPHQGLRCQKEIIGQRRVRRHPLDQQSEIGAEQIAEPGH